MILTDPNLEHVNQAIVHLNNGEIVEELEKRSDVNRTLLGYLDQEKGETRLSTQKRHMIRESQRIYSQ